MRWWLIVLVVACARMSPKPAPTPAENLRTTLARAGIELRLAGRDKILASCDPNSPGCTRCDLLRDAQANPAVIEATRRAFARYPTSALSLAGIDHVAMCSELVETGDESQEYGYGVAIRKSRGLYLSVKHVQDPTLPWYDQVSLVPIGQVVHHELFHLLENSHAPELMREDPEWDALNPLGFVYTAANLGEGTIPGFVDDYGMTRLTEDKATVYAELMTYPIWVCDQTETDEILRAKIALIRRRVGAIMGTDSFIPSCERIPPKHSR